MPDHAEIEQALHGLRERAARRAYGRIYPTARWDNASPTGREDAFQAMTAADVLAVVETDLTLAAALFGRSESDGSGVGE